MRCASRDRTRCSRTWSRCSSCSPRRSHACDGVPMLLWYAHWRGDWTLRAADRLCAAALSVDRALLPARQLEAPRDRARDRPRAVSPPRNGARRTATDASAASRSAARRRGRATLTLLDGFELALAQGLDARLEIRGPSTKRRGAARIAPSSRRGSPAARCLPRVRELARAGAARADPRAPAPASDALVTAADSGHGTQTLDKVVYEASACAVPVIASNPALAAYLDGLPLRLDFRPRRPVATSRARSSSSRAAPAERRARQTGLELRRRVEPAHSVDTWADRVLEVVEEVRSVTDAARRLDRRHGAERGGRGRRALPRGSRGARRPRRGR